VLDVDPDNATARKQVSQVVTAVRQFDHLTPGRRWTNNLPPLPAAKPAWASWLRWALVGTAVVLAFSAGFLFGRFPIEWGGNEETPPEIQKQDNTTLGPAK
jgi:hypothetical protein